MRTWNINPTIEINEISFGEKRKMIHNQFGTPINVFKKSKFSKNTTDDYGDFHVFYNENDEMEAIEVFEGLVFLHEKQIYPLPVEEVLEIDESFKKEEDGCISTQLSIAIYMLEKETGSILLGCKNYY